MGDQVSIINKSRDVVDTGERHPVNPFLDFIEIKKVDKMIFAKTDSQALNTRTGEIMGQQIVASFKKVDAGKFVKIFTDKISHILDLSKAGHKMLILVLSQIQTTAINDDKFMLSFADAKSLALEISTEKNKFTLSKATFDRGMQDIIKHGLIARHYNLNMYFINPAIIYNGDRNKITFVEQYEIVGSQADLLEDLGTE